MYNEPYLSHHGVKGQKWGIRRYQDENGDLTAAGRRRYSGKNGFERLKKDTAYTYAKEHRPSNAKTLSRLSRATLITSGAAIAGGAASQWNKASAKTQAIRGIGGAIAGGLVGNAIHNAIANSFIKSDARRYVDEINKDPEMLAWGENYLRSQGIR